jgi:hypothetical protein
MTVATVPGKRAISDPDLRDRLYELLEHSHLPDSVGSRFARLIIAIVVVDETRRRDFIVTWGVLARVPPRDSGTPSPCNPIFFHHAAMFSIIRPFFGQDCTECGRLVDLTEIDRRLRMTLDGKGNANELHAHSESN